MSDRPLVLDAVQKMPEAASHADILDELEMLASIREGLAQSERGEGVSHEQVTATLLEHTKGPVEATAWRELLRQTQDIPVARALTEADITAEVATVRASL